MPSLRRQKETSHRPKVHKGWEQQRKQARLRQRRATLMSSQIPARMRKHSRQSAMREHCMPDPCHPWKDGL